MHVKYKGGEHECKAEKSGKLSSGNLKRKKAKASEAPTFMYGPGDGGARVGERASERHQRGAYMQGIFEIK